jgi:diguanylate cyclase (GGDEF)-like protein
VFWASLTLSTLISQDNQPVGIVGYLSDITQRKEAELKINRLAYFDTLTQLPNRSLFKQLVDQSLQQLRRKQTSGALLFIDLNRFKPVNDTFGRQIGDALLMQVARRFQQTLRNEDIIARLGSDEFAIALTDVNQYYHASLVAQKFSHPLMLHLISAYMSYASAPVSVSVCFRKMEWTRIVCCNVQILRCLKQSAMVLVFRVVMRFTVRVWMHTLPESYSLSLAYAKRFISKSFSWYINRRSTCTRAPWLALRFCCVGSILSAV